MSPQQRKSYRTSTGRPTASYRRPIGEHSGELHQRERDMAQLVWETRTLYYFVDGTTHTVLFALLCFAWFEAPTSESVSEPMRLVATLRAPPSSFRLALNRLIVSIFHSDKTILKRERERSQHTRLEFRASRNHEQQTKEREREREREQVCVEQHTKTVIVRVCL